MRSRTAGYVGSGQSTGRTVSITAAWALLALPLVGALAAGCRSTQSDPQRPGLRVRPGVAFEMAADAPGMPILDLRRPDEFDGPLGHLQRAYNLPLEELPQRLPEIRWLQERTFLVYCRGTTSKAGTAEGTEAEDVGDGAEGVDGADGVDRAADGGANCGEEAIRFFLAQGFQDAVLLEGGIEAWLRDGFAIVGGGAQGGETSLPEDSGLRVPEDARSIGDPRHLPEPP